MKRRFMIFCSLMLILILAACSNAAESPPADPASAVSSEPASLSSGGNRERTRPASTESENTSSRPAQPLSPSSIENPGSQESTGENHSEEDTAMKINLQIGNSTFTATLEENVAVDSFVELMKTEPLVIRMSDYSGFEKVGTLATSLPSVNKQATTQSGDIVLYNENQIVIFYGSNSWNYTRLGKIDDLTGWEDALGSGSVTVTFSVA